MRFEAYTSGNFIIADVVGNIILTSAAIKEANEVDTINWDNYEGDKDAAKYIWSQYQVIKLTINNYGELTNGYHAGLRSIDIKAQLLEDDDYTTSMPLKWSSATNPMPSYVLSTEPENILNSAWKFKGIDTTNSDNAAKKIVETAKKAV